MRSTEHGVETETRDAAFVRVESRRYGAIERRVRGVPHANGTVVRADRDEFTRDIDGDGRGVHGVWKPDEFVRRRERRARCASRRALEFVKPHKAVRAVHHERARTRGTPLEGFQIHAALFEVQTLPLWHTVYSQISIRTDRGDVGVDWFRNVVLGARRRRFHRHTDHRSSVRLHLGHAILRRHLHLRAFQSVEEPSRRLLVAILGLASLGALSVQFRRSRPRARRLDRATLQEPRRWPQRANADRPIGVVDRLSPPLQSLVRRTSGVIELGVFHRSVNLGVRRRRGVTLDRRFVLTGLEPFVTEMF